VNTARLTALVEAKHLLAAGHDTFALLTNPYASTTPGSRRPGRHLQRLIRRTHAHHHPLQEGRTPMSTTQHQPPILVPGTDAETLADGPTSLITLLADAPATHGALTVNRSLLREGSPGAPPHFHTRTTETFFVIDGSLQVLAGEEILTLHRGDLLVIPPHLPHAFAPAPGREADILVTFTPGIARFDYYRLLERVYRGEAEPAEIAASSEQFDNHYFDSETWRSR
jgi:mannose-6-phosphate isomerase-like protein (cupin superfamily)